MAEQQTQENKFEQLREQAEELIKHQLEPATLEKTDILELIHELRIHQAELAIQNDELKRAQLETEEARNRFSDLYDFAPVGYFTIDFKGIIREANLTAAAMFGTEVSEMIGQTLSSFVADDYQGSYFRFKKQLFATKTKETREFCCLRKDKSEFFVDLQCVPFVDETEHLVSARIAATDITEKKKAEEALLSERAWLFTIFENIPAVINIIDPKTYEMLYMNKYSRNLAGKESLGKKCFQVIHNYKKPCSFCNNDELLKSGVQKNIDWEYFSETFNRNFLSNSRLLTWPDGRTVKLEFSLDTTERKQAEEAIQKSEKKYRRLVENLQQEYFFYLHGTDGVFRYISPGITNILGYSQEEFLTHFTEYLTDNPINKKVEYYSGLSIQGKKQPPYEVEIFHKDGGVRRLEVLEVPIFDDEGNVMGVEGIAHDVTERVNAEEQRANLESQLRQAYKMEAIGTLAGGIAHDFNNVLGIIIGNLELASDDVAPENPAQLSLSEARSACIRAKDMVKQILAFSRQEEREYRPIDIQPIVKEVMKMLRASIPTTVEIQQAISTKNAMIMGDPTQVHQVLINLCTNAADAMSEMGSVLQIRLDSIDVDKDAVKELPDLSQGRYIRLTVSDTGHGINLSTIGKIFDPYFTTKEVGKGTGMGLAVVHGIVREHSGTITVYSEEGKGTTFHVFFPELEREYDANEVSPEFIPRGKEKILFVDDEQSLANLGKRILEGLGYTIESRTSSVEALEAFRKMPNEYDLVVTDMTMPNMTGEVLAKELMQIRKDIPVILCTGFSHGIDDKRAMSKGIRGFVMKPLVRSELANVVRQVLDNR